MKKLLAGTPQPLVLRKKVLSPAARAFKKIKQDTAQSVKVRIQALLRASAIIRDGGCVLRDYPESGQCGGYGSKSGQLILQAEHLNTRERNISYGDMRNIVCLCQRHHGFWKKQHSRLYWELIEKIIGPARWKWLKRVEADKKTYLMTKWDWLKVEIGLLADLKKLESNK